MLQEDLAIGTSCNKEYEYCMFAFIYAVLCRDLFTQHLIMNTPLNQDLANLAL